MQVQEAHFSCYAELSALPLPLLVSLLPHDRGGADLCDEPWSSQRQEQHFNAGYKRLVLVGVGHFPLREVPDAVSDAVVEHLG